MRTLALDDTGDLAFTSVAGLKRLSLVTGADALRQRVCSRLRLWAGTWFGDTTIGVPYRGWLGEKGREAFAEATLRRAIATCPGVAALEQFEVVFDAIARSFSCSFRVRGADGSWFDERGFVAGSP